MPDDALLWTHRPPQVPRPKLAEHVWTLRKNGKRVDAALRGHGEWGWECQFLYNGEFVYGRRWNTRDGALAEADAKQQELAGRGWVLSDSEGV